MRIAPVTALVASLSLGACASYHARPLSPVEIAHSLDARSLEDRGLQRFLQRNHAINPAGASPVTWDLRALTWVALYFHPDLDVNRADWRVAQAGVPTAGGRPNPTLSVFSQYNTDAPHGVSPWTAGPNLDIPLETGNKRGYRIERAQRLAEVARLNLAEVAWQVRSRVRRSLLGVYSTEPLWRRQQALESERVRLMQRRVELGLAAQPDLTQIRIALQQVALAGDSAHQQLAENRVELATSLGLPVAALDGVELSLAAFDQVPEDSELPARDLQRQALLARPDVRAAFAAYEASQAAVELEIAKQYPDLTVGPGLLWDAGQAKWSLGVSLLLPLFNRNQGPIAEARARLEQAAAHVLAVQSRAMGEVDRAFAGYRVARETLHHADALLAAQKQQEHVMAGRQRVGEVDRFTLLGAEVELAAAERARLDTLIQAHQALGALEDAVRRPLSGEAAPAAAVAERDPRGMGDAQ